MIFKSYSEAASLLADTIKEEGIVNPIFTYINPDAEKFATLISPKLVKFPELNLSSPSTLVIIDDGSTNSVEYNEYTDKIRNSFPSTKIALAIPVIPESEIATLESVCDTLIYLHSDPYFFSIDQFFEVK